MASVHGTCAPGFEPLRDLLATHLDDGTEVGASLALIHDGELVVDLWGGEARPGEAWQEDTLVQVWSVTKTMAALTVLVLIDGGLLDPDAPVTSYWPAFRDERVLVRHLLAHTSGQAGWTEPLSTAELLDLEHSERMLAEQEPWFDPGSASGYHMVSYGHLLDGLVRGATGRPLADLFRELVAEPLGADFHLGVPADAMARCADLVPPPRGGGIDPTALPPDNLLIPTLVNPRLDLTVCNTAPWRSVSVAGANGHGNARSIALAQAPVSHGGSFAGVDLLSPGLLERVLEPQAEGTDLVLLTPLRWGLGYGLPSASAPAVPEGRVLWWTGYGGAIVVNDLERRTTFAYAMNRMENHYVSSPRTDGYVRTAFDCLDAATEAHA